MNEFKKMQKAMFNWLSGNMLTLEAIVKNPTQNVGMYFSVNLQAREYYENLMTKTASSNLSQEKIENLQHVKKGFGDALEEYTNILKIKYPKEAYALSRHLYSFDSYEYERAKASSSASKTRLFEMADTIKFEMYRLNELTFEFMTNKDNPEFLRDIVKKYGIRIFKNSKGSIRVFYPTCIQEIMHKVPSDEDFFLLQPEFEYEGIDEMLKMQKGRLNKFFAELLDEYWEELDLS